LDLGLAPGPRKYIQRFFDLEGIPGLEVKPPETTSLKIHRRVRIREATEEKTQKFWAGIRTSDLPVRKPVAFNVRHLGKPLRLTTWP
jgi:hypothetical protein